MNYGVLLDLKMDLKDFRDKIIAEEDIYKRYEMIFLFKHIWLRVKQSLKDGGCRLNYIKSKYILHSISALECQAFSEFKKRGLKIPVLKQEKDFSRLKEKYRHLIRRKDWKI